MLFSLFLAFGRWVDKDLSSESSVDAGRNGPLWRSVPPEDANIAMFGDVDMPVPLSQWKVEASAGRGERWVMVQPIHCRQAGWHARSGDCASFQTLYRSFSSISILNNGVIRAASAVSKAYP